MKCRRLSNSPNPLPILPNSLKRGEVSRIENVLRRGQHFPFFEVVPGVAGADGDKLQDARVAVAIDHAAGAAIPDEFRFVELVDVAHRLLPKVAAIEIEVPIEIKVFVAAEAAEFLLVLAEMALHFSQRFGRVNHRKAAALLHLFDLLENLDQFLGLVIHQAGITEAQVTGSQIGQWIAESAASESELGQEGRQLIVIINQLAGGDTGRGLDP